MNTTILPQGIPEESDDATKKFTNIDSEPFSFNWGNKPFGGIFPNRMKVRKEMEEDANGNRTEKIYYDLVKPIEPGETIELPKYLVNYAAMHLARRMFKKNSLKEYNSLPPEKQTGFPVLTNEKEEMELQKKMVAANFEEGEYQEKEVPQAEEAKAPPVGLPEEKEEKKEEQEGADSSLKCDVCGFEAKSAFGLSAHKRIKHKQ